MLQTYQGYFQDGRFVSPELPNVPENVPVVLVLESKDEINESARRLEAFERFIAKNRAITDEVLDEEFDAIIAEGIRFPEREFDE